MESKSEWYYSIGNQHFGPVSWDELVNMAANGTLSGDDLISREEMNEWQHAELVVGLWGEPDWHYAQNGEQLDPVNWITLKRLAREGRLQRHDLVWHESLPDWIEAAEVADLFPENSGSRPAMPNAIAHKTEVPRSEMRQTAETGQSNSGSTVEKRRAQDVSRMDVDQLKSLGATFLTKAKEVSQSATKAAVSKVTEVTKKAKEVAAAQRTKAVEKVGEAAKFARQKTSEKLAERRRFTSNGQSKRSAPDAPRNSLFKSLLVVGGVFMAASFLLAAIGQMLGRRGGEPEVNQVASEDAAQGMKALDASAIPGGKQAVDVKQFTAAQPKNVKASLEHLRDLEKQQREIAGEFTECRVFGEVRDRSKELLQLFGQSIPVSGDISATGTMIENGNIVIHGYDQTAIAGQYYRPTHHFYMQRTFGKNAFGVDVPVLHFGPAPEAVKTIAAQIKQARTDYANTRKAATSAALKKVSQKYSTAQGKPLLSAMLNQLRTVDTVDGVTLGDFRTAADGLGLNTMAIGKGGFLYLKPEEGTLIAANANQVTALSFIVQPELLAQYFPWVEQLRFAATSLALPLDVPPTVDVAKELNWAASSTWATRSAEIVDITLSDVGNNPELNDYHLLCLTDGERYSLLAVTIYNSNVTQPLLVFDTGNSSRDPLLEKQFSPEIGLPRPIDGSLPKLNDSFVKTPRIMSSHRQSVMALAVSAKGTRLVSAGQDGRLVLWHVKSSSPIQEWDIGLGPLCSVAYSPQGKSVLCGAESGEILHWDLETGKKLNSFKGHKGAVLGLAFAPDGKMAVSASKDKTARVWDVDTATERKSMSGASDQLQTIAVTNDCERVVAGGRDGIAYVWDVRSGQQIGTFNDHKAAITGLGISADQKEVLTGDDVGVMMIWNLADFQPLRRPVTPKSLDHRDRENSLRGISWPRGSSRYLVITEDGSLALYDRSLVTAAYVVQERGQKHRPLNALLTSDGRFAFSGSETGAIARWQLPNTSGGQRRFVPIYNDDIESRNADIAIASLASFADGRRLSDLRTMTPDGRAVVVARDGAFRLIDVESAKEIGNIPVTEGDTVMFSPDMRFAIVHHSHRSPKRDQIELWDFAESKLVQSLGKADFAPKMAVSSGGTLTAAFDGRDLILADRAGKIVKTPNALIDGLRFLPGGQILVKQYDKRDLPPYVVVDPNRGNTVIPMAIEGRSSNRDGWHSTIDGKRLYGGREKLEVFDIATGKAVGAVETGWVPGSGALKSHFAFDGRRVMLVGRNEVRIHDVVTGRLFRTLKPAGKAERSSSSYEVDFRDGLFLSNPDFVLLVDQRGTGYVWNIDTEKVVLTQDGFAGSSPMCELITLSTDGRRLFGKTSQFGITIWDVPEF